MTPGEWQTTTLGAAGRWVSGGTPSTSNEEYWGGDIPWMSSKSLTDFRVRSSDRRLTALGAQRGTKLVPRDTILMVVRGMSLKSEFRMGITQREVALSQDLKGLLPRADLDPTFLAYALQSRTESVLDMVDEAGHGTGRLQTDRLFALELPVPPLDEQRSIASTLSALDDKLESNWRAMKLATQLAAAKLLSGTKHIRVGEVASLDKGLSYKGAGLADRNTAGALPMVNLGNFTTSGNMKEQGLKFYNGEHKPKHLLRPWDLVIANTDLTQARALLGRGFLIPPGLAGALHTHHTSAVRFHEHPELAVVLWAMLQTTEFRDRAMGYATGTTVAALPPETILDFEMRYPEDLDASLVSATDLIERTWAMADENGRITELRNYLISELISGHVRVPMPETP